MSSGHFNERTWHITAAKLVAIFGFVLGCVTMNIGARYFAMCVFTIGTYAVNSIILGWVASSCGQTKEKKAASLAIANVSATLSLIWTPVSHTKRITVSTLLIICSTSGQHGLRLSTRFPWVSVLGWPSFAPSAHGS